MADIPVTIKIRIGNRANLPAAGTQSGEPFFCKDTGEFFIWTGSVMKAAGGSVISVAGKTGAVVLDISDITGLAGTLATFALETDLETEVTARVAAVSSEAAARAAADALLAPRYVNVLVDTGTPQAIIPGDIVCWGGEQQYGNGDGVIPSDNSNAILGVAHTGGSAGQTISIQVTGYATVNIATGSSFFPGALISVLDPTHLGKATITNLADAVNQQSVLGTATSGNTAGTGTVLLAISTSAKAPVPYVLVQNYQVTQDLLQGQVIALQTDSNNRIKLCTSADVPLGIMQADCTVASGDNPIVCIGGVSPVNAVMVGDYIHAGDFLAVNDSGQVILAAPAPGQTIRTLGIAVDADGGPGPDAFVVYIIPTSVTGDSVAALASEASTRAAADSSEATSRANADTVLAGLITSEAGTRASADTTLQTNITAEATARASAVTAEASARATADALLVPKTTTVNGHALSANVTVTASDLSLATVATSGAYTDLSGKPQLAVTNAGAAHNFLTAYDSSTGLFTKAQPAASDVTGLATVATSGAYSDLTGKPQLANTDAGATHNFLKTYDATTGNFTHGQPAAADITGLATVATSGAYSDLTGKPQLPNTNAGTSHQFVKSYDASTGNFTTAQPAAADITGLATVATSGAYSDLTGKPTLPVTNAGATHQFLTSYDSTTGAFAKAQPAAADVTGLATVATSGAYSDLTGKPQLANTIASASHKFLTAYDASTGNFTNGQPAAADVTGLAAVATSGAYADLSGTPAAALPLAGGTLTGTTAFAALGTPAVGAGVAYSNSGASATATANVTINVGDFVVVVSGNPSGAAAPAITDNGTALVLTAIQPDVNGTAIITGTITGGGSNGHKGKFVLIAGFAGGWNNGGFKVIASTTTTLTVLNQWCVGEIHAATAANYYQRLASIGSANFTNADCFLVCTGALVSATSITTAGVTAPSIAAATFTGIGGMGAFNGQPVTTTPGTCAITSTKANSIIVSGFLYVSSAGTITASSSSGTLRTNSDAATNAALGTAIVTQAAATVGSYTNAVALNRTATTGAVWTLELLPSGTQFDSNILQFKNAYWDGGAAVTDTWAIQASVVDTGEYFPQYNGVATAAALSPSMTAGAGTIGGPISPIVNMLKIAYTGEGAGMLSTQSQNVLGSIYMQKLAVPLAPSVTPTGGSATTWNYKFAAFDANNFCTGSGAAGQTTTGAATLTPSGFNTVVLTSVQGAAYYALYRAPVNGVYVQIATIPASSAATITYLDAGGNNEATITPPAFNFTGAINFGGTWLGAAPVSTTSGIAGGLACIIGSTAQQNAFSIYLAANIQAGIPLTQLFTIGAGATSDANDRITLGAATAGFSLALSHSRVTQLANPGIMLGGNSSNAGNFSPTSGVATEVCIGAIGAEGGGTCKFVPTSGTATYIALRVSPTINQALTQTTITNINVTSATAATLTVTSGTGFVNGAPIVVAGCTGTNNAQINGSWTIASGGGTTSIVLTGAGWATGNHAEATGTISQQATGAFTALLVNPTVTATGAAAAANLLMDLQASGVSKVKVDSNGTETFSGTSGETWVYASATELLTLSTSGTTTDTSANLLPANAVIEAVVARVTTTITTATNWKLGDATTAGRFTAADSTMTAGETQVGTVHVDQTGSAGPRQTAAAKVRVTTTGTPGAGVIRITVFYRQYTAPTS